mgnify:CR=1 FL=1
MIEPIIEKIKDRVGKFIYAQDNISMEGGPGSIIIYFLSFFNIAPGAVPFLF